MKKQRIQDFEHISVIFMKMFSVIGKEKEFDCWDFQEPEWYNKYKWTEQQEKEFLCWLETYFKTNCKDAKFREIFGEDSRYNFNPAKMADKFNLNYGWKIKIK